MAFTGTGVLSGGAEEETELQTANVRSGDLVIMASDSGTLLAEDEVKLGFGEQGTVASLYVKVGDQVQAGDILAEQAERKELEAELAADQPTRLEAQEALANLRSAPTWRVPKRCWPLRTHRKR